MAILHVTAPQGAINEYTNWTAKHRPGILLTAGSTYGSTLPHKVLHAPLSDIISGRGFTNAQVMGWRHILTDRQGAVAVETRVDEKGNYRFHEAHSGLMVDKMKATYPALINRTELQHDTYEFSFLRMFSLKICAIWLQASDRANDCFIPLPPYFYGLEADKLYTATDFITITQGAIRKLSAKGAGQNHPMIGG